MSLRYRKIDVNAPDLIAPENGNAGYDLATNDYVSLMPNVWVAVSTGIAVEIPKGHVGLVRGRSGMGFKLNVVAFEGTIDSNYRGELKILVRYEPNANNKYQPRILEFRRGDRFAQLVIVPYFSEETELVDTLSDTNRGENGFGSTGVSH